jgi:hypothetical protein
LIEVLDRHEVEYLIMGGGAPDDADCVVRREQTNLGRLADPLR